MESLGKSEDVGKIIGKRGKDNYLIYWGIRERDGADIARVLDLSQEKYFPPFNLQSILARGYWEPFEADEAFLHELLTKVKDMNEWEQND